MSDSGRSMESDDVEERSCIDGRHAWARRAGCDHLTTIYGNGEGIGI